MKLIFIGATGLIVHLMRNDRVVKQTYDREQDTFRYSFLIAPCFLLALVVRHAFTVTEVLWTFSIYLEAVAILPQLVLMQRTQNVDNLTGNYVFLLGWVAGRAGGPAGAKKGWGEGGAQRAVMVTWTRRRRRREGCGVEAPAGGLLSTGKTRGVMEDPCLCGPQDVPAAVPLQLDLPLHDGAPLPAVDR